MLLPFTRAYEVAKLGRDAAHVCEDAERRFRPEEVRALADRLRALLNEAGRRLEQPRMTRGNVLAELRSSHRGARHGRRDRELSELTLAIIRIKAQELGAESAIETIDRFLEDWPPAGERSAGEGGEGAEGNAADGAEGKAEGGAEDDAGAPPGT